MPAFQAVLAACMLLATAACGPRQHPADTVADTAIPPRASTPTLRTNRGDIPLPPDARIVDTEHYRIHSTAPTGQARAVGDSVEALRRAYFELFPEPARARQARKRLELVLYRDRAQFQRYNRASRWAEAYYRTPRCHAYFDPEAANPHHWMLHEATHQLQREVSGFARTRWIDEGLASYLGSSRMVGGELRAGDPDPDAYPIWHLARLRLSGNMHDDIAAGRFLPLDQLMTGVGAPPVDGNVNTYYVNDWSLTHFLLRGDGGRHAAGYRRLVKEGGGLPAFERLIGPLPQVQAAWYEHLLAQARGQRLAAARRATARPAAPLRSVSMGTGRERGGTVDAETDSP